jgi:hypothetical protein
MTQCPRCYQPADAAGRCCRDPISSPWDFLKVTDVPKKSAAAASSLSSFFTFFIPAQFLCHAPSFPGRALIVPELRRHARCGRMTGPRGARYRARGTRAATLYPVGSYRPDHDASMRIGGEAPRRRTHSTKRYEHHGFSRVTATSDCHRMPTMFCSWLRNLVLSEFSFSRCSQYDASRDLASGYQPPQGN